MPHRSQEPEAEKDVDKLNLLKFKQNYSDIPDSREGKYGMNYTYSLNTFYF